LTISFYRRPVQSPVHPKMAKKPDWTGFQSTSQAKPKPWLSS
jgi:hypothetical protein